MWSRVAQILTFSLILCGTAYAEDVGRFTLVPKGGVVPFESTCFDDVATARLLTWREFQEQEFQNRLQLRLGFQKEELTLEIDTLKISLEETTIRFEESLRLRDEEIESLRTIIKKDRKTNLPLIIAGSVLAGVALGVGTAYAIDKAFQ
tara:strand:+ start:393 stop:839 length:447 start_codon:yes stop_codon:yes gene_type:complete